MKWREKKQRITKKIKVAENKLNKIDFAAAAKKYGCEQQILFSNSRTNIGQSVGQNQRDTMGKGLCLCVKVQSN